MNKYEKLPWFYVFQGCLFFIQRFNQSCLKQLQKYEKVAFCQILNPNKNVKHICLNLTCASYPFGVWCNLTKNPSSFKTGKLLNLHSTLEIEALLLNFAKIKNCFPHANEYVLYKELHWQLTKNYGLKKLAFH